MASINGLLEKPQPTAMENMGKPPTAEESEHRRKSPSFSTEPNLAKAQAKTEICHRNIRNQPIGDPKHQKSSKFTPKGPILTIVISSYLELVGGFNMF